MINILYLDTITYSLEEVRQIFNSVKEALPKDETLIALPVGCRFERLDDNSTVKSEKEFVGF